MNLLMNVHSTNSYIVIGYTSQRHWILRILMKWKKWWFISTWFLWLESIKKSEIYINLIQLVRTLNLNYSHSTKKNKENFRRKIWKTYTKSKIFSKVCSYEWIVLYIPADKIHNLRRNHLVHNLFFFFFFSLCAPLCVEDIFFSIKVALILFSVNLKKKNFLRLCDNLCTPRLYDMIF